MKKALYFSLFILLASPVFILTSCGDDDTVAETCTDGIQNGDETGIDCGGSSCEACPTCDDGIQNGDETGVDCGGATCEACPTCDDGIQNGDEEGIDCGGSECDACLEGLQGEWQSSGTNVAPLLVGFFNVDSIYANFSTNSTYVVHQFDVDGVMTTLEGTYAQSESNVDGIWNITVNQTSPVAFTSSGIFQVTSGTPDEMRYEIVVEDGVNVPPTPEDGFGSSNAGALGDSNIQTYLRID